MDYAVEHTEIAGIPVHVSRREGAPLIFLMRMIAWESGIWDHLWKRLLSRFSVANFDFLQTPAARMMDRPREGFSRFAEHCVEIAQALGHERFHLLGWVGGAQVTLRCAVDQPDRVASCILLAPHFELPDMRSVQMGNRFKQVILEKDRELYSYHWVMSGLSSSFVENNFDAVEKLVAARMQADRYVTGSAAGFAQWSRALRTRCVADDELSRVKAPTLVVSGTLERSNAGPTPSMARLLAARIPGAELSVIDDVGELMPIEAPDRVAAAIDAFLVQ